MNKWSPLQDRLMAAIRQGAPEHTIIANPGGYQLVEDLVKYEAHPDRNVIYAVHFYEPSPFTHQGAVWMKDWYHGLRSVPWPLTKDNLDVALTAVVTQGKLAGSADKSKQVLRDQVDKGYGSEENVTKQMKAVTEWAAKAQRRVVINEFGVYKDFAPRDSRLRYLQFVRQAFEDNKFGWTMWDYAGQFALVEVKDGKREIDPDVVKALGLAK